MVSPRLRFSAAWFVASLGLAALGASPAYALWPFGEKGIPYKVQLQGVEGEEADWLRAVSLLEHDPQPPPKNILELESLASADVGRLTKAMKARGYYEAAVNLRFLKDQAPPVARFEIDAGPKYIFAPPRLQWQGAYRYPVENLAALAPLEGKLAEAQPALDAAKKLEDQLNDQFCLFSLTITPATKLDAATHIAEPVYVIEAGPPATFGPTTVSGRGRSKESLVQRNVKYKEGACFRKKDVDATRSALLGSQLYGHAEVKPATVPGPDGSVPIAIDLTERKPRTLRLGTNYATDTGAGVTAKWEHRNLDGDGLKATVDTTLSQLLQGVDGKLYFPAFLAEKQTLTLQAQLQQETTDAYDAKTLNLLAGLERPLIEHVTGGGGLGYRLSNTTKKLVGDEIYGLVYAPFFLQWDDRNDAQNATKGVLARATVTPYTDTLGGPNFLKSQFTGQTYLSANVPLKPTLAMRAALGSIDGAGLNSVPPDVRFYAGGGGSVRGYAYQSIGGRDAAGDPLGGTAWAEGSVELRVKFTEEIGAVAFLDGGAVGDRIADAYDNLLFGAGMGLRYYTPVGPLRLDVGVPLDKREGIDSAYQLYVSLGQAF